MSERPEALPSGRAGRASGSVLPYLLFVLLVVVLFADPLFVRRSFAGRDLLAYNLPIESAIHSAWSRGRLPVWIGEVSGGRPLSPNPNAGAFYPVRWLLAPAPFPTAMRVYPILHWIAAGFGMLLLLGSLGASRFARWVGAASYVFSGVGMAEVFYTNHHPGVVLLPWIVWAAARPGTPPIRRSILLSVLLGLDLLAGDPFTAGLGILAALAWAFTGEPRPRRAAAVATIGGAFVLALLFAAPQIVASALWIPETSRAVTGVTLREASLFSLRPLRLLELLVPYPFGATWAIGGAPSWGFRIFGGNPSGFFPTLYAGGLALIGAASLWRSGIPAARFARAVLVAAIVLSAVGSFLPAQLANRLSPIALRYPEKFAVGIAFSLALFAGLAFDAARTWRRLPRWTLGLGGFLALLALAAFVFPSPAGRAAAALAGENRSAASVAGALLPGALAEGCLLWILTLLALELVSRNPRGAALAGVALLSLVPVAASRRIARTYPEQLIFEPTAFARTIARQDPSGSFRVLGASLFREPSRLGLAELTTEFARLDFARRTWFDYTPVLWRRGTVFNRDFDHGDLSRLESLRRLVGGTRMITDPAPLFASLGLRWAIRYRDEPPVPGYRRFSGDRLQSWDENPAALPDVRLAQRWEEASSAVEALKLVAASISPLDLVVETGQTRRGTSSGGTVRTIEKTPELLRLETDSAEKGMLFVLRGFWPHRRVLIDGSAVDPVPAQLAFSALVLPPGRHRIEWREEVPGWKTSRWGPILGALLVVFLLARLRPRKVGLPA